MAEKHKSIILGITGASGTVYGLRLLEYLLSQGTARKRTNSRLRRTNDTVYYRYMRIMRTTKTQKLKIASSPLRVMLLM